MLLLHIASHQGALPTTLHINYHPHPTHALHPLRPLTHTLFIHSLSSPLLINPVSPPKSFMVVCESRDAKCGWLRDIVQNIGMCRKREARRTAEQERDRPQVATRLPPPSVPHSLPPSLPLDTLLPHQPPSCHTPTLTHPSSVSVYARCLFWVASRSSSWCSPLRSTRWCLWCRKQRGLPRAQSQAQAQAQG